MDVYSMNIKKTLEIDQNNEGDLYRLFSLLGGEQFSKLDMIH